MPPGWSIAIGIEILDSMFQGFPTMCCCVFNDFSDIYCRHFLTRVLTTFSPIREVSRIVLMLRQLAQPDLGLSQVSRKTRFLGILLHAARDIPVATLQVSIFHPVHRILPDRQSLIMENRRTVSGVTHIPILTQRL